MITSLLAVVLLGAPGAGSPRAVVARATAAIEQGALVEAEALLAEAARQHPQSTLVARERAVVLLRLGAGERALAEVDRALAGGDVEPEVHELRARILAAPRRARRRSSPGPGRPSCWPPRWATPRRRPRPAPGSTRPARGAR